MPEQRLNKKHKNVQNQTNRKVSLKTLVTKQTRVNETNLNATQNKTKCQEVSSTGQDRNFKQIIGQ